MRTRSDAFDLVILWKRADGLACVAGKRPPFTDRRHDPRWQLMVRRGRRLIVFEEFVTFRQAWRVALMLREDFAVPDKAARWHKWRGSSAY